MATKAPSKVRPGYVRVLNPVTGKTFPLRLKHANNPNYMREKGLVIKPEPIMPPTPEATAPLPVAKEVTKAAPVKQKSNG